MVIPFAQVVPETDNGVLAVSDQLRLGLCAMVLFSLNVGQHGRDLTVTFFVCDDFSFALLNS